MIHSLNHLWALLLSVQLLSILGLPSKGFVCSAFIGGGNPSHFQKKVPQLLVPSTASSYVYCNSKTKIVGCRRESQATSNILKKNDPNCFSIGTYGKQKKSQFVLYSKQNDSQSGKSEKDNNAVRVRRSDENNHGLGGAGTKDAKSNDDNLPSTNKHLDIQDKISPPPQTKNGSDSISFQLFKLISYVIQFLGFYFSFGLLLNILGYGYSFDFQNGFQMDKLQNIRNEREFQREMNRMSLRETYTGASVSSVGTEATISPAIPAAGGNDDST